jgi:hypothetical protein
MSRKIEIHFDQPVGRDHVFVDPDDPTTEYSTTAIAGTAKTTTVTRKGVTNLEIPLMYEPGRERVSASRLDENGTTVTGAAHLRALSGLIHVERFTQGSDGKAVPKQTRGVTFVYDKSGPNAAGDLEGLRDQLAQVAVTALETTPKLSEWGYRRSLRRAVRPLGIPLTLRR